MPVRKIFLGLFLLVSYWSVSVSPVLAASSSITTLYLGSQEKVLDEQGNVIEEKNYVGLPYVLVVKTKDGVFYLYQDHLASTRLVADETCNKIEEYDYYPYGSLIATNQQPISDKLYTSQTLDPSTNLYYYHARYYNPETAHFLSADSAEGANRYAYVAGNPTVRNDPSGNMLDPGGGGGGGIYLPMIYSSGEQEITVGQFMAALQQNFVMHPFTLDLGGTWQNIEAKKEEIWRNAIGDETYEEMTTYVNWFSEGMSIASYTGTLPYGSWDPNLGPLPPKGTNRRYLIDYYRSQGVDFTTSDMPGYHWAETPNKQHLVPGAYDTDIIKHEGGHLELGHGPLPAKNAEFWARETVNSRNTVDWLLDAGYPKNHPQVQAEMVWWQKSYDNYVQASLAEQLSSRQLSIFQKIAKFLGLK